MKKRRVFQHDMEDRSRALVRSILPNEWVVRDYTPDYGIDIAVEIFEPVSEQKPTGGIAEAAGECFFAQIKSANKGFPRRLKVYPRHNVEKASLDGVAVEREDDCADIDAIPYRMDVKSLLTVQSLGAGIPVLLFLVTLDTERLYFVCMNDLIDKCILPDDKEFERRQTKTIYVPVQNWISGSQDSLVPLRFLAKRAKLYSAFAKFAYQENETQYLIERLYLSLSEGNGPDLSTIDTLLHFIKVIKRYDFWRTTSMWQPVPHMYKEVLRLEQLLTEFRMTERPRVRESAEGSADPAPPSGHFRLAKAAPLLAETVGQKAQTTWGQLKNLGNMHEEICREWFLPTYYGALAGHPLAKEALAQRVLRQARSGRLDEDRLLPRGEGREEGLAKELDRLGAQAGWYEVVAARAHEMATGEAPARRNAEVMIVRQVACWRQEVERFAPRRLDEFDSGIRHALEHSTVQQRSEEQ